MTLKGILEAAAGRLRRAGCESPRLDAEVLLAELLGVDRAYFYAHPERGLTAEEAERYEKMLSRREDREPVAYITGKKEFMGLDFAVGPGVLIPRPESETVVEAAARLLPPEGAVDALDLCCGSGALGIALCSMAPGRVRLTLSDVSGDALEYTKRNLKFFGLQGKIVLGDLFENVNNLYHIIMANPPYIKAGELGSLQTEIRNYEPQNALCGGESGYDFYERIIKESAAHLRGNGFLVFEVGDGQASEVASMMEEAGFVEVGVESDLLGIGRCVHGKLPDTQQQAKNRIQIKTTEMIGAGEARIK